MLIYVYKLHYIPSEVLACACAFNKTLHITFEV